MYLARLYDWYCLNVHFSNLRWVLHLWNLSCCCLCPFPSLGKVWCALRMLALSRVLSFDLALRRLWLCLAFLFARLLSFAGALSIPGFRSFAWCFLCEDMKRVGSKFFNLTNRLIRTRRRYHNLAQQVQQIQTRERATWSQTFFFRSQSQRSLTTKLERSNAERWYLDLKARGETWKKSLHYKFKETSLAIDASMAYDQMQELEQTVDYESLMKECLACESVCKSKISTLEILRLPEELSDSVEQTALTRAKKTLLMKAMLERAANEEEARKNAKRQAGEKKRQNWWTTCLWWNSQNCGRWQ